MRTTPLRSVPGKTAGFTLLEMVITLSIFILLAAAVFGIMTGVLQGASSLQDNQNRRDQIAALNAFLKKKLGEMPAGSALISYRRGDGEGLAQNGIILGQESLAVAIDAKVQANGYYTLRYATFTGAGANNLVNWQLFEQAITNDDASINWSPLIRDIKAVSWKFQDLNITQWLDQWNNASAKPNLVEFSTQLAGDSQPVTMDFWLPRIDPVSNGITPQPVPSPHVP